MTTINNSHLIEKVGGIERAREIVEGAPDWANGYNTVIQQYVRGVWFSRDFRLNDLRTAITLHYSREFKVGDLVCFNDSRIMFPDGETKTNELFRVIRSDGLEIDLTEIGYSKIYKTWVGDLRHATPSEIKAGHRMEAERHG